LTLCIEDLDEGSIEDVRENLCKVVEISRRSASKVEGVLQIARAGRDGMPATAVSLSTIIQEIWVDLTGDTSDTELLLDFTHQGPVVTELPTLKVIVENMLSNALRYVDASKPKHQVCVKSEPDPCGVKISISDNGIGISQANLPKVFQMFKRLDDRSGDGLGLSLVQKQVERLGGSIDITSVEGDGTTITFTLPMMEPACD